MENIQIKNLGPIAEADINFGDLTFFVGPQASGKSIVLQLIKLITDKSNIETNLNNYGFVWGSNENDNLERFFGEGMSGVWNKATKIDLDGRAYSKSFLSPQKKNGNLPLGRDDLFYIPAQRVLCLNLGWPRFFNEFDNSVPYILKDFSETLRQYLEIGFAHDAAVFPQKGHDHEPLCYSFDDSIFHGGKITVDLQTKKRLKLNIDNMSLPFMTWSAGQKEFMPLLLAFYWLTNKKIGRRKGVNYVIIEEPEMGLHPEAIKSVILQILNLLSRGYKVIVSTHSPVFLEFAWAFNILKNEKSPATAFDELFDVHEKNNKHVALFDGELVKKSINTYYFNRTSEGVKVKDISSLDAGAEDLSISEWGGLSSFSSKANDIISSIVADNG